MREACGAFATKKSFNLSVITDSCRVHSLHTNYFVQHSTEKNSRFAQQFYGYSFFLFFRTLFVVFLITIFLITLNIALVCELCCGVTNYIAYDNNKARRQSTTAGE